MVRVRLMTLMKVAVLVEMVVAVAMQTRPEEPTNISVLSAVEVLHAPQSE